MERFAAANSGSACRLFLQKFNSVFVGIVKKTAPRYSFYQFCLFHPATMKPCSLHKLVKFFRGSRPWRNQNPGNLVVGKISRRNGAIGKKEFT